MSEADLDRIEAVAQLRGLAGPLANPADTLKLIAEVRRLRGEADVARRDEREACARLAEQIDVECDGPCECPLHGRVAATIRARGAEGKP